MSSWERPPQAGILDDDQNSNLEEIPTVLMARPGSEVLFRDLRERYQRVVSTDPRTSDHLEPGGFPATDPQVAPRPAAAPTPPPRSRPTNPAPVPVAAAEPKTDKHLRRRPAASPALLAADPYRRESFRANLQPEAYRDEPDHPDPFQPRGNTPVPQSYDAPSLDPVPEPLPGRAGPPSPRAPLRPVSGYTPAPMSQHPATPAPAPHRPAHAADRPLGLRPDTVESWPYQPSNHSLPSFPRSEMVKPPPSRHSRRGRWDIWILLGCAVAGLWGLALMKLIY
ncbi:MAG: hypothetical protein KTR31_05605 [Myxococcales bacterium]|nr:hypothetical protein [Myxococcales bacterium]